LAPGTAYTITDNSVTASRPPADIQFFYSNVESLTLTGSPLSDTFHLHGTAAGTTTTLNGGDGIDVFSFGSASGTMNSIQGPLVLDGRAGPNFVSFYDWASTVGHPYTYPADTMTRDGMAPVRYYGMNQLIQYIGLGDDRINWRAAGAPFFLNLADHG